MNKLIKYAAKTDWSTQGPRVRASEDLLERFETTADEARNTLDRAHQDAANIILAAKLEVRKVIDEAYQAAYSKGLQDGIDQAEVLIARLEEDIALLAAQKQDFVDTIEPDLLKLCLDAVEKVIRHEIKTDPRIVVRHIKSCLRRLKDRSLVDVRVNPQEVEYVRSQRDELMGVAEGTGSVNILDDRRVAVGGCVVESVCGTFDATIKTQFEQVSKKIMEIYENGRGNSDTKPE